MIEKIISNTIRIVGAGNLAVTVRGGLNSGLRWTFFPWTSYWRGTHEPLLQSAILKLGDLKGKCCWDLGAHFGFYSAAFSARVGKKGHVYAFEPSETAFKKLKKHQELNNFTQLKIFKAAVSDSPGTRQLLRYDSAESTTSHFAYDGESTAEVPIKTDVVTYSLDKLVEDGEIHLPDVIKLDVEGHGHMALKGATGSIRKSRPTIFMGVHCVEEKRAVHSLLKDLNYSMNDEEGNSLTEVPDFGDIVLVANNSRN